jgi:hypothetical protein
LTADGFWQNAAWETLDEFADCEDDNSASTTYSQTQSVPEPTATSGLLIIAVMALAARLKRRYSTIKNL